MRRGAKPEKDKVEAKLPATRKSPKNGAARARDLEKRLAEVLGQLQTRERELVEAQEQQTATAEILRVISASPTDVQPVFDAITESAARLCGVADGWIVLAEGDTLRGVSAVGQLVGQLPVYNARRVPLTRESVIGRAILDRTTIHIDDLAAASEAEYPEGRALQRMLGHRTQLVTPLLREGVAIGAILLARFEVRLFSERQIELLKTFADQAVIAIENVRLFKELQARNRDLTEALEQQTATSEILRVISSSPTAVQPVFETIAARAMRLCEATVSNVFRFDGALIHLAAMTNQDPNAVSAVGEVYPMPPGRASGAARAVLTREIVQIPDVLADPEYSIARAAGVAGFRSVLSVPMLGDGAPLGAINVGKADPGPFTAKHVALLQTFANQAVIAIENARLFNELQEKNQALTEAHAQVTEALEQQTATSEILRVISSSPTDVQPVFVAICQSAVRLFGAYAGAIVRSDGDMMHLGAVVSPRAEADQRYRRLFPRPLDREFASGRAILDRAIVHVPDTERETSERNRNIGRDFGYRRVLVVPMLREGDAIGALAVTGREPGRYSDQQIALLKMFADQAVIAIENVRLFTELQEKNRALTQAHAQVTETLEQQMATGEILRVIASSPTDVQPVFDTIVRSAAWLCHATMSWIWLQEGDWLKMAAPYNVPPGFTAGLSVANAPNATRVIREGTIHHIGDTEDDSRMTPEALKQARTLGVRAALMVPMRRDREAIGALTVYRSAPGPFSDTQVKLLETFASQAVIAIENVRLFKQLQERTEQLSRSVDQLTALGEVGRAVTSTLDLETVLTTIVSRAVELSGLDGGVVFEYDDRAEEFVQRAMTDTGETLAEARRTTRIRKGEGVLGRTAITLEPVQVADIAMPGAYEGRLREILIDSGIRAILAVPMVREGHLIGCLGVTRNHPGEFPADTIDLLRTFATQSALAIQNARLFREIELKSRELEAASQHKSEFLANMSHELRTPLNAIIGFSEVLGERMFGELNEKQEEYLKDIYASGQHLLSLINDILDLSKIEAGRMELERTDFNLPATLDNALTLVRERAGRRGIALGLTVDERLEQIRADERKVRQVVLNLLSNAIKFTPEKGRIEVRAAPSNGAVEVSVSDTGVGIAPEDQEAIFEEFRQVGTAAKKVEGTGLGLALSRKFVELHGGRIWVESQVGVGSTFTFTIPSGHDLR